jgi:aminomethyltransferase
VANAGNRQAAFEALSQRAKGFAVDVSDRSDDFALIAIQGPKAAELLQTKCNVDLSTLRYYSIASAELDGTLVHLARTGYTGEDGFEVLAMAQDAEKIWDLLLGLEGVKACGLAARDTLRLEAGMPLYGHELDLNTNPFEAGLGKTLRFDKEFVGSSALESQQESTPKKKLFALKGEGRRAARQDYEIFSLAGDLLGRVTSGVLSPTLGYPIALAYLNGDAELEIGSKLEADVRGTKVPYEVVAMPFYKREVK